MALSNEDKKDVKVAFGKKVAGAVSKATHDRWAADSKRAKSQFDSLHASGKMGLPSTAPSKWDSDHSTGAPRAEGKKKDMAKKMSIDYSKTNQGKKEAEQHRKNTEKMFRD